MPIAHPKIEGYRTSNLAFVNWLRVLIGKKYISAGRYKARRADA